MTTHEEKLLREIFDCHYRTERVHESDCPACDIAADVAGTLAACWDPNGRWDQIPVHDGLPGDTVLDQAERIAAFVLHRRMLGYKPSLKELMQR